MEFSGTLAGGLSGSMHFGSDGDTVDINPIVTSGTKIATFTVNAGTEEEVVYDLYTPDTLSWNDITDKPTLFSGSYNDLTNKPTLNGSVINGNMFTNVYSNNETRIGTWTDGKPLYRRVLISSLLNPEGLEVISNFNADTFFAESVWTIDSNNKHIYCPNYISMYNYQGSGTNYGTVIYSRDDNEIQLYNNSRQSSNYIGAIICYTKP